MEPNCPKCQRPKCWAASLDGTCVYGDGDPSFCHGTGNCAPPAPPPVAEQQTGASDLTGLIEKASNTLLQYRGVYFDYQFSSAERDEIVLALRVLRVLRSHRGELEGIRLFYGPLVPGIYRTREFGSTVAMTLDETEYLLGIGGRNDDQE